MIVSHKYRFIFLKTRKTAGTSTECALSEVCGPDDIATPFAEANEEFRQGQGPRNYHYRPPLWSSEWPNLITRYLRNGKMPLDYYGHMHAWRAKKRLGRRIWNSYFKFAFDRNPWDREVSWYSHQHSQGRFTGSFAEHIKRLPQHTVGNFEIYSCNGQVSVDFLGQYENLQADLAKVMDIVGIKEGLTLPRANGGIRDNSLSYQHMYDATSRDVVRNTYKREIELLNYSF